MRGSSKSAYTRGCAYEFVVFSHKIRSLSSSSIIFLSIFECLAVTPISSLPLLTCFCPCLSVQIGLPYSHIKRESCYFSQFHNSLGLLENNIPSGRKEYTSQTQLTLIYCLNTLHSLLWWQEGKKSHHCGRNFCKDKYDKVPPSV